MSAIIKIIYKKIYTSEFGNQNLTVTINKNTFD
jgi:hypothetical protein